MEPLKEFESILLTLDNCTIPKDRLVNTPSSKDGMPRNIEIDVRILGCECIQSAGLLLKLPQAAMATAQILFQRFFYAKSFVKFNFYYAAMASLFLAAKIEECNRRLRDVLNVFHHLKQKRKGSKVAPMDYVGEEYYRMRNTVSKYERYILKELGFCVHVQHPHKLLITCLQLLELEKNKGLVQNAWNLMNDSLRTNIFVRYEVQTIACACVYLAARQLKIPLPENPPWWKLFDVRYKDMKAISLELLTLYARQSKPFDELEKQIEILKENLMSQKKVEIKEINLKPSSDSASPLLSTSPNNQSPAASIPKSDNTSTTTNSNPSAVKTTDEAASNGLKRERTTDSADDDTVAIADKKLKLSNSRQHTRTTPEAYRPIISPIKLSSDSQSDLSESSPSTVSQPPNGHSHHLSNSEFVEVSRSRKHHRHKHRSSSSKHHRRHRSREHSSDRKRHHHYSREERNNISSRDYGRSRDHPPPYYR